MSDKTGTGALSDLRVIEMGQLLAGPFCGQLLADFGAEVIKVEPPGQGDPMREWGREKPHGKSLWWPVVARNKKSVEINAREPDGQAIIKDLMAKSDILIENFRPGTMEKWGLGYDVLSNINPRLVMIRVSGLRADRSLCPEGWLRRHRRSDGWSAPCRGRSVQSSFPHRHIDRGYAGCYICVSWRPYGNSCSRADGARTGGR